MCFILFQCVPVSGLGFRRGSYKCVCRPGFYFPDTKAERRYYNGTVIEEEYEKLMMVSVVNLKPDALRRIKGCVTRDVALHAYNPFLQRDFVIAPRLLSDKMAG